MDKEIVFTSSYSSQLGALISLSKYLNDIDLKKHSKKIIIFQISSKGDLDCNYSCFRVGANIILGSNFNIRIIKINKKYKRLILLFALSALKFSVFNKNLSIWEPYPNWLKKLFVYKKINLNLFKNYLKGVKYFGDGFLCLSETTIPFWLNKDKLIMENNISKGVFYYFYNLNTLKSKENKYIKIEADYIKNTFEKLNKNYKNMKKIKYNNLIIFPLTTFFETKRSSLESEINLYLEYITEKIDKINTNILIKPHPSNIEIKKDLIISRLKFQNYNVINENLEKNKIISLPLQIIPLELLCSEIVKKLNINRKSIKIAINSNATLSTSYLFPEIECLEPFGEKLISKYLKKTFIKKRLIQEEILIKKIYHK